MPSCKNISASISPDASPKEPIQKPARRKIKHPLNLAIPSFKGSHRSQIIQKIIRLVIFIFSEIVASFVFLPIRPALVLSSLAGLSTAAFGFFWLKNTPYPIKSHR
ncbi:MAG: hypothetical protein WC371_01295 [Parachlamydiales bacterium]|jgi:hypothetical protein